MITKEMVEKMIKDFCEKGDGCRDFTEAYSKNVPFYYKRHKSLVVPSSIINEYFGCPKFRMSAELVDILKGYGAKRVCRQTYECGKQSISVQCWVFNV